MADSTHMNQQSIINDMSDLVWSGCFQQSISHLRNIVLSNSPVIVVRLCSSLKTWGDPRTKTLEPHTLWLWGEGEGIVTWCYLGRRPKESSNGEPLGAGLQTIYTRLHEGCTRLSVGLCTVHDIIVELGARLYDVIGGNVRSMRHRSRLL